MIHRGPGGRLPLRRGHVDDDDLAEAAQLIVPQAHAP